MAKRKRHPLKPLTFNATTKTHRELSDIAWALDRPVSEIIREMVDSDLPRFKDRHRKAISDGKKSEESPEATDSGDSQPL